MVRRACVALASLALVAPPAHALPEGPPLSVPNQAQALECRQPSGPRQHEPVLLIHGTFTNVKESWDWGYLKVLPERGFYTCAVEIPDREFGDTRVNAEYVVAAVRAIHARTHHRVDVIGHSQGTMLARWAMRFWPDVGVLVDDFISLAGPHQGSDLSATGCNPVPCPIWGWHSARGSNFVRALARPRQVLTAVDTTSIFTQFDELIQPPSIAVLDGAENILLQDVCAGRPVDHVALVADAPTFYLVLDAFTHPGPTDRRRIPSGACLEGAMPGADLATGVPALATFGAGILAAPYASCTGPNTCTTQDPPLPHYAIQAADSFGSLRLHARALPAGGLRTLVFTVTVAGQQMRRALVTFAGHSVRTGEDGTARLRVPRRPGLHRASATAAGYKSGHAVVRVRRATTRRR